MKHEGAAKLGLELQGKEAGNQFLQIARSIGGLNWLGADEYLPVLPLVLKKEAMLLLTSYEHL